MKMLKKVFNLDASHVMSKIVTSASFTQINAIFVQASKFLITEVMLVLIQLSFVILSLTIMIIMAMFGFAHSVCKAISR